MTLAVVFVTVISLSAMPVLSAGILQSRIFFSVVVRGRLFSFVRVDRVYTENPTVHNTVGDFYRSQDKNHKQHESFHDERLAIHAQL